nr:hypothetical protein [Klebsiella michiganensis]
MLSQARAAHNGLADDDVFLSCKAAQSVFSHINHSGMPDNSRLRTERS